MQPSGYQNIIIPGYMGDGEAHNRLLIGYALDEDAVALNQWATVIGVDKPTAYYPVFNSSDFVRLKDRTGNDRLWADSAERPTAMQGVRFTNKSFQLERYGESAFVGNLAEEYTEIGSLITLNQDQLASRALVWRSVVGGAVITDPTKYFTTAVPAVTDNYFATWAAMTTALTGAGKPYPTGWFGTGLYTGTIAAPVFKRFLGHTAREIRRRTNGRVKISQLLFLANPNTFGKLAATEEMHAYVAQQSGSLAVLKGESPEFVEPVYGLPQPTYQIRMVGDATTITVGAPLDPTAANILAGISDYGAQEYVIPDDFISVLTRPGSVVGMRGSTGFSSVVLFQNKKRALKPTTFPDVRSERVEVAMEDMFTLDHVAPDCSFAIGSAVA
jgi:hypothetical protein